MMGKGRLDGLRLLLFLKDGDGEEKWCMVFIHEQSWLTHGDRVFIK